MDVVMIIVGVALAVVFMANVHVSLRCLGDKYKPSRPPAPPPPKSYGG